MAASARRRLVHSRIEQLEYVEGAVEAGALPVQRPPARRTRQSSKPRTVTATGTCTLGGTRMASRAPFATISLAGFGVPGTVQHRGAQPSSALMHTDAASSRYIYHRAPVVLHPGRGRPEDPPKKTAVGTEGGSPATASRRPVPHFMVASTASDKLTPAGVPAWRGVLANLLAGAMAGCAVEAGEALVALVALASDVRSDVDRPDAAMQRMTDDRFPLCTCSAVPDRHDQDAHADGADRRRRPCPLQIRRRQGAVRR